MIHPPVLMPERAGMGAAAAFADLQGRYYASLQAGGTFKFYSHLLSPCGCSKELRRGHRQA